MRVTYNYEYPKRLRACFIGAGAHAYRNIYPTFAYAPVDLVAICDLQLERAQRCATLFGAKNVYTNHQEMLAVEKPDVVFIVTGYSDYLPLYPVLAMEAMRAGANVWIEKPPAGSAAAIREMMRVSEETQRQVGVGFKKMFFPANVKAKALSQRAEFGRISCITARYPQILPPYEDRASNEKMINFLDHFVHPHSLLKFLGGPIESLFVARSPIGSATVTFQFKSGAIGNLLYSAGQASSSFYERTEIIGEGENLVVDNNIRVTLYRKAPAVGYGRSGNYFDLFDDTSASLHWEPEFSLGQLHNKGLFLLGYAPEIIHFTTRLLEGHGPEWGTLDDALELMLIYEAYRKPDGLVHLIGK